MTSSFLSDSLAMLLEWGLSIAGFGFLVLSIVLFIVDGIKAKRQHRKRKVGITIMFIISIILAVLLCIAVFLIMAMIVGYVINS